MGLHVAGQPTTECGTERNTPIRIFIAGDKTYTGGSTLAATMHDFEVLSNHLSLLKRNYEYTMGYKAPLRRWYEAYPECADRGGTRACDEFPLFGTEQGGPYGRVPVALRYPSLSIIDAGENSNEGVAYSGYTGTSRCGFATGTPPAIEGSTSTGGTPFIWLAIPPAVRSVPTGGICVGTEPAP